MPRIMVVDDDPDLRSLMEEILASDGHEVQAFPDGQKALSALAAAEPGLLPELIIADVMMPEMDGFTLHNELQENPKTKDIPVIVISAYPRLKEVFSEVAVVKAFLLKPVEPQAVRDAVAWAMRRPRPQR